jgi:hypothetical protein
MRPNPDGDPVVFATKTALRILGRRVLELDAEGKQLDRTRPSDCRCLEDERRFAPWSEVGWSAPAALKRPASAPYPR